MQFQSCHLDPVNSRVHLNVEKYEKLLDESPPVTNQSLVLKRPDSTYLRTRKIYEKLCQTKGSQVSSTLCSAACDLNIVVFTVHQRLYFAIQYHLFLEVLEATQTLN